MARKEPSPPARRGRPSASRRQSREQETWLEKTLILEVLRVFSSSNPKVAS